MYSPFKGLTNLQINKLYHLLGVHIYQFHKNQEVLPTIRFKNIMGIILKGSAQVLNVEYNGDETKIEELEENSVFGSNLSATNNENYQIIAKQDTEVLVIDYDKLMNPNNLQARYFTIFLRNLFDIMNTKIKEKNEHIRVLGKKQIREKLLEYFEIEYKKSHSSHIYLPMTLKNLADYLGTNRSAMFRELKHLKEEKIIEVKGNRITLLYKLY